MRRFGRRVVSGMAPAVLAVGMAVVAGGCESVEWGGIDVAIERPEPPPRDTLADGDTVRPDTIVTLPDGPVLFHVRRLDRAGRARIEPVAEVADTGLLPIRTRRPDLAERYARHFIDRYYEPGSYFALLSGGARVGSFVLESSSGIGSATCPRLLASGQVELRPFADMSEFLAWPAGTRDGGDTLSLPRFRADMRELSVILADRLIRGLGDRDRWRLRPPVLLEPVRVGEGELGFAATFTMGDSVAAGPPADSAGMAFLVADHAPARGYFPLYFEADTYGPGGKRMIRWLDRLDVLPQPGEEWWVRAYGDASQWYEVIAGSGDARRVVWSSRDPVCEAQSPGAVSE